MQASIAFVGGILIGVVALAVTRPGKPVDGGQPIVSPAAGSITLGLAIVSVLGLAVGMIGRTTAATLLLSIAFAFAAVISGVGGLVRKDRRWQQRVGLVLAGVPALFWVAFAVGEVLFPH